MAKRERWFQPRTLEDVLFDFALYTGDGAGLAEEEAIRRNQFEHGRNAQHRKPGDPWITPLMELKCSDMRKTAPRPTDIFIPTRALLLSDRAREVLEPLAGPGVDFLPVEVRNGAGLWWVSAPVVPEALDKERSKLTMLGAEIMSINRPVLRPAAIPEGVGFLSLDPIRACQMVSEPVADAIRAHDLFGIELREIEVI